MTEPSDDTNSDALATPDSKQPEGAVQGPDGRLVELSAAHYFSGPLPPPAALSQYEEILPGMAERIVATWEGEVTHRRGLEKESFGIEKRGQVFAFILAVLFLAVSAYLIVNGQDAAGVAIIIAEIVALVGAFLYDRRSTGQPPVAADKSADE